VCVRVCAYAKIYSKREEERSRDVIAFSLTVTG
jgi:hypothetical protein